MKLEIKIERVFEIEENTWGIASICLYDKSLTPKQIFISWTLERTSKKIQEGKYNVTKTYSPKFKRKMLLINNVKGRSGIRIHPFNTAKESQGCITFGIKLDGNKQYISYTTKTCEIIENLQSLADTTTIEIKENVYRTEVDSKSKTQE